jgi:hypothetical protein
MLVALALGERGTPVNLRVRALAAVAPVADTHLEVEPVRELAKENSLRGSSSVGSGIASFRFRCPADDGNATILIDWLRPRAPRQATACWRALFDGDVKTVT